MGMTKVVVVRCDGYIKGLEPMTCSKPVSYKGLEKDLEAEAWYEKNYRSTGARSLERKLWFCSNECQRSRGPGSLGYREEAYGPGLQ